MTKKAARPSRSSAAAPIVTPENWHSLKDDVQAALAAVEFEFDPIAARNLILFFRCALEDDALFSTGNLSELEKALLRFVSRAFNRFASERAVTSLDQAFGLKRAKGERDRPDNTLRNIAIAACVTLKIREEVERGRKPKEDVVYGEVADDLSIGIERKAIEKIYAENRKVTELLETDALASIAPIARLLPKCEPFE